MGEEDRLVRRLGAGHAGEVFEAVLEGKVYALKLYTSLQKHSSEKRAYTRLSKALTNAKKEIAPKSTTAARAQLIRINSFCQEQGDCAVDTLLEKYSGPTQSCFLSYPVEKYCHLGMRLEMIHGPTLDDDENGGTGAVTTVLKMEGQRRRVWERLRDALEWLHWEVKMVHGSVNGRNIILVRVAERMRTMEDERKEEEEGEEEEEDYMPVLIDFNHADMRECLFTEEGWRYTCKSELDKTDRLLPMVALKDMKASQDKTMKSDYYCNKFQGLWCGACSSCVRRRLNRLKNTVRGVLGYDGRKYADGNEEIVQPMSNDALQVVGGILRDIYWESENGMDVLRSPAEKLLKDLLWPRQV